MRRTGALDAFLLIVWCLILAGQGTVPDLGGASSGSLPEKSSPGLNPFYDSPRGAPRLLKPQFTPIAVAVPPIGTSPIDAAALPTAPNLPGAFGQSSGAFAPPPPLGVSVGPPQVLLIPPPSLGQGGGVFAPASPQLQLLTVPLAGNAPQSSSGIPFFVPFGMGPTALLNQFVQPPIVPFGQVGIPIQGYLPGFFTGNVNPFNRSCNYYFFQGCGPSGGAVTNFNFSTR